MCHPSAFFGINSFAKSAATCELPFSNRIICNKKDILNYVPFEFENLCFSLAPLFVLGISFPADVERTSLFLSLCKDIPLNPQTSGH